MNKGKVYIVGAGPGDIGLFTIKGLRILQKSQVVVYDFHLNAQILNYISTDAEFVYAGKRGGHHEMTQEQINEALVKYASEGKIVCRLKGGDPFVFGRGGEEAQALKEAGIAFEIIPGVSSAIAAPAYAGIPITHRRYSSSFAVITGNEDLTKRESAIDWAHFARGFDTLVFLMGVKNVSAIASKLIENGKSPDTPTAVVRWGTRPDQKTIISALSKIASVIKDQHIKPPAVMIVGNVVKLRDSLRWYEDKPLFGHRILITREYSYDYEALEDMGAEIFGFPTIKTVPSEDYSDLDRAIHSIGDYQWLIFTSAKGVSFFLCRFISAGRDIRDLKGIRLCAVGTKTAEALAKFGLRVDLMPEEFNSEGLVDAFVKEHKNLQGVRMLLPRPDNARNLFPDMISQRGGTVDTPVAYRVIKPERHGKRLQRFLKEGRITVATFTSAATFNNFVDMIGEEALDFLRGITIASIGPVTTKAIEKAGLRVEIQPKEATIKAMSAAIIDWAKG